MPPPPISQSSATTTSGGSDGPKLILYQQTHHDSSGNPISILPLLIQQTQTTHVIIAAFHINDDPNGITLNDNPPTHEKFNTLWGEVRWLQGAGITVMGMLGGAAKGSFERLGGSEEQFNRYYQPLLTMLRSLPLTGLDLDIEEEVPLSTATRLITRLRQDMGPDFIITLAPVITALIPSPELPPSSVPPLPFPRPLPHLPSAPHLSGFSYAALFADPCFSEVAWLNAQVYNGWGSASIPAFYSAAIAAGWPAEKVVFGVLSSPRNGNGYVPPSQLRRVVEHLRSAHPGFAGLMAWEYFNAGDGDRECIGYSAPWDWVTKVGESVRSSRSNRGTAIPQSKVVSWPNEDIEKLVALGFERQEAVAALDATGGNVELAAGFLFG